ncbi:MAG: peptidase M4 family protein [Clostridium sp.]|nr:peptidase M4 family protein [Clostridium sp.]
MNRKKIVTLIAMGLTGAMLLEGSIGGVVAKADVQSGSVQEFSSVEELKEVNDGQAPEVYSDDASSFKFIDGSFTNIKVEDKDDAIESIKSVKNLMDIDNPEAQLKVAQVNTSDVFTSYKLQQVYKDVPVYGREVVVATDKDGETTSVSGNYLNDVKLNTTPKMTAKEAEVYAATKYGNDAKLESGDLVIYSLNDVEPTLCWKVTVTAERDGKENTVESFVDASNGNVVDEVALMNKSAATASAKDLSGKTYSINVNKTSSTYELYDTVRKIKIYDAKGSNIPGTLIRSSNNSWSDATAVSAMVNIGKTYDYYSNKYGRKSYDNKGSQVVATIHYKENGHGYDNAYWSSYDKQFVFGDGYQYFTPLTGALDVIAHEFTHAVISSTCNLAYRGESGALNEAYADVMGNIIEGDNDSAWLIGEDIMKPGKGAGLRSMSNPEQFSQPSKVGGRYYQKTTSPSYYNDYGGVHTNSGIFNHAVYLMWKNGISDKDKLAKLCYNSLFLMNSSTNFKGCRAAILSAAKNMHMSSSEITIITNAFNSVGITA